MKKIILKKLLFKNYLKTSLVSIIFVSSLLIFVYYNINNKMIENSTEFLLKDVKQNTTKLVQKEIATLRAKFHEISHISKILKAEHEYFFKNIDNINTNNIEFKYASNGIYYKTKNSGSSVFVSSKQKITPKLKQKLIKTEIFDITFKTIVEQNPSVVAVYFNSYDNFNRYYPFIKDVYKKFPNDFEIKNYNFYTQALIQNNPNKDVVFTDVYLDPAGQGWLLSCIVPIYNNDFLEGVTGIDISLDMFIKNFFKLDLPYDADSFIVDKSGTILVMNEGIEKILNIKELNKYKSNYEKIDTTVLKPVEFNIYKNEQLKDSFKKLLSSNSDVKKIVINNKQYLAFINSIGVSDWKSISLIPVDKVLSKVTTLEKKYKNLGILLIFAIIFFYALFLIFLYKKSKEFVQSINTPLKNMVRFTQKLVTNKPIDYVPFSGIYEIDKLAKNFNNLSLELTQRTQKLVQTEALKIANEKLANTDALTGVYNRRFLDGFSKEFDCKPTTLSAILFDIDNFKDINDTYGHNIGDKVILKLIEIIDDNVRQSDCIIRLGGDEFLLLLKDTNEKNAKMIAQKIVQKVEENSKIDNTDLNFSISYGTCEYGNKVKTINELIIQADKSMYGDKKQKSS